ncbi:c1q-like [uncultured Mediterranean phage uvMED]|nr:c1q-like [uncultured Mediterranean phage uvMED]
MGYVGVPPQSGFITTAKQRVTSSTNNYVDLDHSISSLADVIVWVNFVKQDSTNLSLTTSTRITLGGTLVASDIVEIAYLGKAVATQTPDTGTVTNDMLAGSIANSKLANSSVSINGSSVSLGGSITGIGEANTPSFRVRLSSDQTVANQTTTKLAFATEDWDTDSAWNTSNYNFTVPSGKAGKYFFYGHVRILSIWGHDSTLYFSQVYMKKNNTDLAGHRVVDYSATTKDLDLQVSTTVDLAVGDVIDFNVYHNGAGQQNQNISSSTASTFFTGFKVSA